jgi:hypothetical protein
MGNEALHEIAVPTAAELHAALGIADALLGTLYELPALAKTIEELRDNRRSTP